jgi:hypothetical protein
MHITLEPRAEIALRSLRGTELTQTKKALVKLAAMSRREVSQQPLFSRKALELAGADYYVIRTGANIRLLVTFTGESCRIEDVVHHDRLAQILRARGAK